MTRIPISPGRLIAPIFFLVVAAIVFWQTNTDLVEKDIASGSMQYNAAFVPEVLAIVLIVLAVFQIVQTFRLSGANPDASGSEASEQDETPMERGLALRSFVALVFLALYIFAMRPLGYHIATPLLLASLFALLNVRNVFLLLGLSVGISYVSAYVFGGLLNVVLPAGVFEIAPF
ncbi:tripartite tricarboxylate transporter TctB family protein [Pararhizobium sp. IMCC21322]|uniref:tripartite tricarboxylate transporter TctB family protein n=1 Tax=Pararhizobium sp. IMCC21322 TaxID=3067903 RepID=UPI0027425297|nr:tripartite tricarboxylate transporter TctB family protein [Pararhizobium sp. IMCC21322]